MCASADVDIGYQHTQSIAQVFGLPVPTYIQSEYCAVLTANEVRQWCDHHVNTTIDNITRLGMRYREVVPGLSEFSGFEAGIRAINQLSVIVAVMRSHASEYIYKESLKCPQGKGRRDTLRKVTRRYRFSFY
jgi:hypothetical protein